MAQIIEITIEPDGKVTTSVKGGCGASCKDATKPIRDALGETVEDKTLPEYHLRSAQRSQVKGSR